MMDPTELNDPAKAEAFVRESIADLADHIARLEAFAEKKIQEYRARVPNDPSVLLKITRSIQEELHARTEPLRQHRERLVEIVNRVDEIKCAQAE
jgi:hypothetical protein